ncbi:MAG: ABC transporter substrate-binding protein, partial [Candidatus Methanospirareceae archaeon]
LPGFKEEVPAVINNRVHIIDNDFFGPSYVYGLAYIAKCHYPEIFSDFDPQAIHQEYINKFCGIDFDVSKQGAFVYP